MPLLVGASCIASQRMYVTSTYDVIVARGDNASGHVLSGCSGHGLLVDTFAQVVGMPCGISGAIPVCYDGVSIPCLEATMVVIGGPWPPFDQFPAKTCANFYVGTI